MKQITNIKRIQFGSPFHGKKLGEHKKKAKNRPEKKAIF